MTRERLQQIATACRNGAAMLEMADNEIPDREKRHRIQRCNCGQAKLLRAAADELDKAAKEQTNGR